MLETNELKINYFTYLIYIKQKSDIFKGYWIWDNKFLNLKNKLAVQLLYNHRPCLEVYKFISMIKNSFTLKQLDNVLSLINKYSVYMNSEYEYFLFCNAEDAIKEVNKHKGDIYFDYDKTIQEDCLQEK